MMNKSKIRKTIYWITVITWIAVITVIGLTLSSCYSNQQLVQSYRQVLPIVVMISGDNIYDQTSEIRNIGTGFFVSKKCILTNAHVARAIEDGTVKLRLWNGNIIPAKKIAVDDFNDLALLQIDSNDIKTYKIPVTDLGMNPQVGETIFVVGSPNAFNGTLTKGILSRGTTKLDHLQWYLNCEIYLIDANSEGGSSGSPVFDIRHRIVGIVSGYFGNFTIVIPSYSIHSFLKEHNG